MQPLNNAHFLLSRFCVETALATLYERFKIFLKLIQRFYEYKFKLIDDILAEAAAAYVRKSGKQTGKFSRKIRNCKTCSDVAFHGQIYMDVNQQL